MGKGGYRPPQLYEANVTGEIADPEIAAYCHERDCLIAVKEIVTDCEQLAGLTREERKGDLPAKLLKLTEICGYEGGDLGNDWVGTQVPGPEAWEGDKGHSRMLMAARWLFTRPREKDCGEFGVVGDKNLEKLWKHGVERRKTPAERAAEAASALEVDLRRIEYEKRVQKTMEPGYKVYGPDDY